MAKKRKCMDICVEGEKFICIFDSTRKTNNYRFYRVTYEPGKYGYREHRKLITAYANFASVLCWLKDYAFENNWGFKDYFPVEGEVTT